MSAVAAFESNVMTVIESDGFEQVKQQLDEFWHHLVVDDGRWETRGSFSLMVTKVIFKVMSASSVVASRDDAKDLVLWCLKGGGDASYEGLLSLMVHGEPKSASERKVELLSLELSNW